VNHIEAYRGQNYQYFINLKKDTADYTHNLEVGLESFRPSDSERVPELITFDIKNDYSSWLSFDKAQLSAKFRQKAELSLTLQIPQEAKAGGYYFAIILSGRGPTDQVSGLSIN